MKYVLSCLIRVELAHSVFLSMIEFISKLTEVHSRRDFLLISCDLIDHVYLL